MANARREIGAYGEQWRVTIPASKQLPPVYNLPGLAPSSTTDSQSSHREPKDSKILRYRLLACDQRSFLTGSRRVDMQAAYIINTVRKDDQRRRTVEELLTQQGLQPPSFLNFRLEGVSNCILLEASYHVQWDLYGTFCIVPAVDDARAMLSALRASNQQWIADEDNDRPVRPLDLGQPPFYLPSWDIVVIHPQGLLPDGETLPIAHGRYFQTQTHQPPQDAQVTWTYWTASGDQLVSSSDPTIFFPPFAAQDARSITPISYPPISSLAMVVNANAKLQSFMRDNEASATPRITMFTTLVSELMDEIFFVPKGFHSFLDNPLSLQAPRPVADASSISAVPGMENLTRIEHGFGQPSASVDPMQEPNAPEQPDDDDGLTSSEFRLLAQRARDPELGPRDRSDAASMQICGVRDFEKPYSFESLVDV